MKLTGRILCASLLALTFSSSWALSTGLNTIPKAPNMQANAAPSSKRAPAMSSQAKPQQNNTIAKNTTPSSTSVAQNTATDPTKSSNNSQLSTNANANNSTNDAKS